jgi:hypothetical protein
MISNAHVHNQTSVASLNVNNETSFNAEQGEDISTQKEEALGQYHTSSEDASFKVQLLAQRSKIRGYRGL